MHLNCTRRTRRLHVSSYKSYTEPALNVWEAGIPADILLTRVTPPMIDAVKLRRAERVKKCSVDRNLQVLRRFFNWCIEQGLAADNPLRRVKFFRADTKRLRYLTEEQLRKLLDEADKVTRSPYLRVAIELAVYTGLRRGNLLGLQWEWVDWLNRVVRVPRTKSGKPLALPLNGTAYAALQRLWTERSDSPFVFAHAKGTNAGEAVQDFKKGFHRAVENAGIEDFRWHDLRHTFASWLVMRGASLRAVAELLGHQTMQMTMRYAHLSPGYLSTEIGLLDGVRDPKRAKKGQGPRTVNRARAKVGKMSKESGAPCRTRTCDLLVRSQTLYPTELRARRGAAGPRFRPGCARNTDYTVAGRPRNAQRGATGTSRSRPEPRSARPGKPIGRRPSIGASPAIARTADASARS